MKDSRKRPTLLASWRKLSILILTASLCLGVSKCNNNGAPELNWNPKLYAADSRAQAITRKSGDKYEVIRTRDKKFDSFICTHNYEIENLKKAYFYLVNSCEKWKKGAKAAGVQPDAENFQIQEEYQNLIETYEVIHETN